MGVVCMPREPASGRHIEHDRSGGIGCRIAENNDPQIHALFLGKIARELEAFGGHGGESRAIGSPENLGHHLFLRSEEHTSELQSLMRISYAVFCLKKKKHIQ